MGGWGAALFSSILKRKRKNLLTSRPRRRRTAAPCPSALCSAYSATREGGRANEGGAGVELCEVRRDEATRLSRQTRTTCVPTRAHATTTLPAGLFPRLSPLFFAAYCVECTGRSRRLFAQWHDTWCCGRSAAPSGGASRGTVGAPRRLTGTPLTFPPLVFCCGKQERFGEGGGGNPDSRNPTERVSSSREKNSLCVQLRNKFSSRRRFC